MKGGEKLKAQGAAARATDISGGRRRSGMRNCARWIFFSVAGSFLAASFFPCRGAERCGEIDRSCVRDVICGSDIVFRIYRKLVRSCWKGNYCMFYELFQVVGLFERQYIVEDKY